MTAPKTQSYEDPFDETDVTTSPSMVGGRNFVQLIEELVAKFEVKHTVVLTL